MFDAFWMVLTLLQLPPPMPVTMGLPDDAIRRGVPTVEAAAPLTLGVPPPPPIVATGPATPLTRPATPPARLVRGKGELSYVSTGGTAETQTIGTAAELVVTPKDWRFEAKVAYLRSSVDEEVRARRLNGQLRASHTLGDRAEVFGRATYLRNSFAGINNSLDAAAGVTAIIFQAQPQRLAIDSGFGYLTEDRTQGLGRDLASVDFGLRHQWEFSRRNRFTNDAAIKTDIERTSDWRLNHVAAIQASLNATLSLKISHELTYRNEPVPGFTRADTVASAAIVATF